MPRLDRLGIVISLAILGLLLSILVPLPSRGFQFILLGSEVHLVVSGSLLFGVVLAALLCAGVDSIVLAQASDQLPFLGHRIPLWMLSVSVMIASMFLLQDLWRGYQAIVIGLTGLCLAAVFVFQYQSVTTIGAKVRTARVILNVLTYATALVFFVTLYGLHLRSIISGTAVMLCSIALSLELLRMSPGKHLATWIYALVIGLVMGEFTWSLNYYHTLDGRLGGASLLLMFYVLTGLAQQHLWNRLTRRVAIEFALVGIAGLVLLGTMTFL